MSDCPETIEDKLEKINNTLEELVKILKEQQEQKNEKRCELGWHYNDCINWRMFPNGCKFCKHYKEGY